MTEKKTTRFKPGQSGNPGGRPAGSGSLIRTHLVEAWDDVRPVLLKLAKEGDMGAIRIIAERVCAPMRAVDPPSPCTLPAGSLTERGNAVIEALAAGTLSTGQASQILQGLGALAKITEADELERRIAALEAKKA